MRNQNVYIPGVTPVNADTGNYETGPWSQDGGVIAVDGPRGGPIPGSYMGSVRPLRGLGDINSQIASIQQQISDAQDQYNFDIGMMNDAAGSGDLDSSAAYSDAAQQDQATLDALGAQLASLQAQASNGASSTTPTQVRGSIDSSTQAALLAANPNVFNATTVSALINQIGAAMKNANLTSVQKQALQNQLATYQGGLLSSANMPWLMIGLVAVVVMMGKK